MKVKELDEIFLFFFFFLINARTITCVATTKYINLKDRCFRHSYEISKYRRRHTFYIVLNIYIYGGPCMMRTKRIMYTLSCFCHPDRRSKRWDKHSRQCNAINSKPLAHRNYVSDVVAVFLYWPLANIVTLPPTRRDTLIQHRKFLKAERIKLKLIEKRGEKKLPKSRRKCGNRILTFE